MWGAAVKTFRQFRSLQIRSRLQRIEDNFVAPLVCHSSCSGASALSREPPVALVVVINPCRDTNASCDDSFDGGRGLCSDVGRIAVLP